MRNTLEKYGEEKPLWVTEFGASTFEGGYTELGQALYIISGLLQMKNLGIEKVMIYEFRDSGNNASDWESNLGIFRADYSPKMVVFFLIIYLRIAHLMA